MPAVMAAGFARFTPRHEERARHKIYALCASHASRWQKPLRLLFSRLFKELFLVNLSGNSPSQIMP